MVSKQTSFIAGKDQIYNGSGYIASFECAYPVDIEVTSGSYKIKSGSESGSNAPFSATGSLAGRFRLSLTGVGKEMIIGSRVSAIIAWDSDISALSGITFHLYQYD